MGALRTGFTCRWADAASDAKVRTTPANGHADPSRAVEACTLEGAARLRWAAPAMNADPGARMKATDAMTRTSDWATRMARTIALQGAGGSRPEP